MVPRSLLLTLLLAAVSPAQTVTSIAVRGTHFPVNLTTQVGLPYNSFTIEQDLRRLWATGRFDDIRVETNGTAVTFHVVETPQLTLRKVRIEPSTFSLRLDMPPGSRINRFRAEEIAREARRQLREQGYPDARVGYELIPSSG